MRIDCPIASAAVYPNMRSAAGFHDVMMLFRSFVMIASSDDSTTAASRRLASAACVAFADVARDLRRADHAARIVVNRRDRQRNRDERAVLPLPDRLEVRDRLTGADARQDHVFFGLAIGRDDHANRLADGLGGGVAEHAFGRPVPGRDDAVQILADDGVVRRFDDPGEMANCDVIRRWLHAVNTHLYGRVGGCYSAGDRRYRSKPPFWPLALAIPRGRSRCM